MKKIETHAVKNDAIFNNGDFTTTKDREKEEKMNKNFHNDKKFQIENNNINTCKVFDNNIDNEEDTKVNNDWYLSSQQHKTSRNSSQSTCSPFEDKMKAKFGDSLPSRIFPLEYVIFITYLSALH